MASITRSAMAFDNRVDNLLVQIGELKGGQTAMRDQITQINNEILHNQADIDRKHEQNVALIQGHMKDDTEKFAAVNKIVWKAVGIAMGAWTVFALLVAAALALMKVLK